MPLEGHRSTATELFATLFVMLGSEHHKLAGAARSINLLDEEFCTAMTNDRCKVVRIFLDYEPLPDGKRPHFDIPVDLWGTPAGGALMAALCP